MSRLILLTGPGGAGTSTVARATLEAAREEGAAAELVDVAREAGAGAIDLATSTIGRLFAALGADGLPVQAWVALPEVRLLSTLLRVSDLMAEVDAVVVDAGPLTAAADLVQVPQSLERLLDAALTPTLAMWRSSDGDDVGFGALSDARRAIVRLRRMLQGSETSVRLVVPATLDGAAAARHGVSVFTVLGVAVEGIVLNRFPKGSEDWPRQARREAESALDDLASAADGIPVWKSTSRVRPVPKGRSVLGPQGGLPGLSEAALAVAAGEESYVLELPLAARARATARVGVTPEALVVEYDGRYRWLELPAVLRRCEPLPARRRPAGLRLEFRPDPDVWMGGAAS